MKRLAVLRHAKSSWADAGMADFDRPLNDRGRAAARSVGRALARRKLHFDMVLASPAERVRQTLAGLEEEYRFESAVRFEPRIYDASANTLIELVRALPDACGSALLVGHNPGLQELLLDLSERDERGLRERVREQYPTAALAVVELPERPWAELRPGAGEIVELVIPRDLAD